MSNAVAHGSRADHADGFDIYHAFCLKRNALGYHARAR
jgi:hypothetical protein